MRQGVLVLLALGLFAVVVIFRRNFIALADCFQFEYQHHWSFLGHLCGKLGGPLLGVEGLWVVESPPSSALCFLRTWKVAGTYLNKGGKKELGKFLLFAFLIK